MPACSKNFSGCPASPRPPCRFRAPRHQHWLEHLRSGLRPGPNEPTTSPWVSLVSPGYFKTITVPLVLGRDFDDRDMGANRKVMIVNETFARHYFGKDNPIGRRGRTVGRASTTSRSSASPGCEIHQPSGGTDSNGVCASPARTVGFEHHRAPPNRWRSARTRLRAEAEGVGTHAPGAGVKYPDRRGRGWPFAAARAAGGDDHDAVRRPGADAGCHRALRCAGIWRDAARARELGIGIAIGATTDRILWLVLREARWVLGLGMVVGLASARAARPRRQKPLVRNRADRWSEHRDRHCRAGGGRSAGRLDRQGARRRSIPCTRCATVIARQRERIHSRAERPRPSSAGGRGWAAAQCVVLALPANSGGLRCPPAPRRRWPSAGFRRPENRRGSYSLRSERGGKEALGRQMSGALIRRWLLSLRGSQDRTRHKNRRADFPASPRVAAPDGAAVQLGHGAGGAGLGRPPSTASTKSGESSPPPCGHCHRTPCPTSSRSAASLPKRLRKPSHKTTR